MIRKDILQFIVIAFGLAWIIAWLLYVTGTTYGGLSSQILVAVYYMWAPATAAILVHSFGKKEALKSIGWNYESRTNEWLYLTPMIVTGTYLLYLLILFLGGNVFCIEGFGHLDFSNTALSIKMWELSGADPSTPAVSLPFPAWGMFIVTFFTGLMAGSTINLVFTFGEELGWRGFLLKNIQHLGFWKTTFISGIIWGLWHAPLVAMGHNFPGTPISGIFIMTAGCLALTPLFNYAMHKSGSILIPSVLHAIINGTVNATQLYLYDNDPRYTHFLGLAGIISILIVTVVIFLLDRNYISTFSSYNQEKLSQPTE
ncbi:MAG: CPBP family intramembrane metalloprotease [Flavobacteriales bacterium]|nr:CPBP family intramembrane metalloprotease [Flavobacteriales bacterium]